MTDLRVICTDRGQHGPIELAVISWVPAGLAEQGFAVWSASAPLRDLASQALGDGARGTKSAAINRQIHRSPVDVRDRKDGGKTYVMPKCPKCGKGKKHVLLRDDRLAAYVEKTADSGASRAYDVSVIC
jgi:hypothetical protein